MSLTHRGVHKQEELYKQGKGWLVSRVFVYEA